MTWSVVFRDLSRDKYVAFGEDRSALPIYLIDQDWECLRKTRLTWPGSVRFMGEVYYDQQPTDIWSESDIKERYGSLYQDLPWVKRAREDQE